jgi:hypothetical protein
MGVRRFVIAEMRKLRLEIASANKKKGCLLGNLCLKYFILLFLGRPGDAYFYSSFIEARNSSIELARISRVFINSMASSEFIPPR